MLKLMFSLLLLNGAMLAASPSPHFNWGDRQLGILIFVVWFEPWYKETFPSRRS